MNRSAYIVREKLVAIVDDALAKASAPDEAVDKIRRFIAVTPLVLVGIFEGEFHGQPCYCPLSGASIVSSRDGRALERWERDFYGEYDERMVVTLGYGVRYVGVF